MTTNSLTKLQQLLIQLRDPQAGCPWSKEQTLQSLVPHTLEEVYEVIDAITQQDPQALREELADLLLQIAFYSQIAAEAGWFNLDDVAQSCVTKQLARKPHLQDPDLCVTSAQAVTTWETIKAKQRQTQADDFVDIAKSLPALIRAKKIQARAARFGFDWPEVTPVFAKCAEELTEIQHAINQGDSAQIQEEIGDLLFACVNLARHVNVCPEQALLDGNNKFIHRFKQLKQLAITRGLVMQEASLAQLEELWQAVKQQENTLTSP